MNKLLDHQIQVGSYYRLVGTRVSTYRIIKVVRVEGQLVSTYDYTQSTHIDYFIPSYSAFSWFEVPHSELVEIIYG